MIILPNENEIYILNPSYIMQNDLNRIILFSRSKSNDLGVLNWESFLHPLHAKILSFFTFERTLKSNISLLSKYFEKNEKTIRKIIFPFIENSLSVYTKFKEDIVRIPKNLIINLNRIVEEVVYLNLKPEIFECRNVDIKQRRINRGPQLISIMLNNTCLSDCVYCYADKKTPIKNSLSTFRIMELIDEANTLPVQKINLMGGEIFLHTDWRMILTKIVDGCMSPEYISTKYPLTDKIIQSIQDTNFKNPIQISLDAVSSDLLMQTLSVDSDYKEKVLKGIKLLDKSGLNYRINSVLSTCNTKKEEFEKLFGFISGLKNITDWRVTPAVNSYWIEYNLFRKLKPVKNDITSLYEYIETEIVPYAKIPILLNKPAINRKFQYCTTGSKDFEGYDCSALNNHLFILPDGKATICEQLYWLPKFIIGDVSINSIAEVWNSPAAVKLLTLERKDIQNSSPCRACGLFETCFNNQNRCWVDIIKAYGYENWDYPDPRCAYAPEMIHNLDFY